MRIMAWAAVISVSFLTSSFFLACGSDTESIRATQAAFMQERQAAATAHAVKAATVTANNDRARRAAIATARAEYTPPPQAGQRVLDEKARQNVPASRITRAMFQQPTPVPAPPPNKVKIRGVDFLCYDISATYRIHHGVGHSDALDWVQIAMNLETDGSPYIRPSDAQNAWVECQP